MTAAFDDDPVPPLPPAPFLWLPVWLAALLHFAAWLTLGLWLYYRVPHFGQAMHDMDVELPELAVLVISFANIVLRYWFVLLPALLLAMLADARFDALLVRHHRWAARTAWFLLGFAPPGVLLFVAVVSLDLVLLNLLRDLTSFPIP